jgi:hypothetical protein
MNALRKLSTGQRAAVAYAALVTATAVTEIRTGAGPGVRVVTVLVVALVLVCCLAGRLIGIGQEPGQHAAPRGWTTDLRPLPVAGRVIPRAAVEGAPPWQDQPPPDSYIVATGTLRDGRLTSARVAVLPPLPAPVTEPARPSYVTNEIGDRSVDAWLDSAYNRAMARQVRELTDGAS